MPPVKNVEKKIWDIEGFDVVLRGSDGHDVRGDRRGLPQYPYDRAAKNDMTVEAWKARRFRPTYPGFDVDVVGEGPLAGQPPSGVQLIDVGNRFRVVHDTVRLLTRLFLGQEQSAGLFDSCMAKMILRRPRACLGIIRDTGINSRQGNSFPIFPV